MQLAITVLKAVVAEDTVEAMLAVVGGVMLAVCFSELYPEGRKCGQATSLHAGVIVGALVMLITLQYEA